VSCAGTVGGDQTGAVLWQITALFLAPFAFFSRFCPWYPQFFPTPGNSWKFLDISHLLQDGTLSRTDAAAGRGGRWGRGKFGVGGANTAPHAA
jgi:hypothetical protein